MKRTRRTAPTFAAALWLALLSPAAGCRTAASTDGAGTPDTAAPQRGAATAGSPEAARPDAAARAVTPGLEILLRDSAHLVRGKRVGLITNQSAVTRRGELAIDYLARQTGMKLVALYSPEHGIRGNVEAGEKIATTRDERTGLPIYSLYGSTQRPTDAMLQGVDVLLFDMQDIGARPYTFVWTMTMAMEEAAKRRIPFVVLDRPNPITADVDGPVMDLGVRNVTQVITGYYSVPLRHGMTAGEIARYFNADAKVGARLHVIPAEGWRGDVWFDQTGLPFVRPSPNIRSVDAELKYSGLVLAEATNVHAGRGTEAPFSYFGAPWLDAERLKQAAARYELPGVEFEVVRITPTRDPAVYTTYRDTTFNTLRLKVTERNRFRPVLTTLVLLTEAKRQNPQRFRIMNTGFTQMIGSQWARQAFDRGDDPRVIARRWEGEVQTWKRATSNFWLYPRPQGGEN